VQRDIDQDVYLIGADLRREFGVRQTGGVAPRDRQRLEAPGSAG